MHDGAGPVAARAAEAAAQRLDAIAQPAQAAAARGVHATVAVVMIAVILGHIYIGTLGMEGAYDAMGSGEVDLAWAKAHHSVWVQEQQAKTASGPQLGARPAPAE